MDELALAEEDLAAHLRMVAGYQGARPGWAYGSVEALMLAEGRWCTPAPWPGGGAPPGTPDRCYPEAAEWAADGALAYVEGWAWAGAPVEHAWCTGADGTALDVTWSRPGRAYLGLPIRAEDAVRLMSETHRPLLHGPRGLPTYLAHVWCRDGIPQGLRVEVGRPVT
ncbi:hypothetical protein ACFY9R_31935 [Streptomyces albidoflavus]|uniref:hypothetical protein n=1 Tax=Streptomyces albidoflavus TaxID=1886 RepID=UPI0033C5F77C